jgi:chemotaxis protein MotB
MEDAPAKPCPAGIPPWVLTFADLMSLLLAFFVLLFSFSEMDRQKYKQVAGSMKDAFGIQREVKIKEPPKGVNIIAQEFSAGTPNPRTQLNELRQHTTDDFRQYLKMPEPSTPQTTQDGEKGNPVGDKNSLESEGARLRLALAGEIDDGFVEVDILAETIVIRILERGSFASASTTLIEPFRTVLEKMAHTIGNNAGVVVVAGHTDSVPISTDRFRSNWELSASRAVTVVHELMRHDSIPPDRFRIEGYGDTQPIERNDTDAGRARNRRVEVTLLYDNDSEEVPVDETRESAWEEEAGVSEEPLPAMEPDSGWLTDDDSASGWMLR